MREDQYGIHAEIDRRHWWWRARREIALAAIARVRPWTGGLRVVEVGCGTGGNLPSLGALGSVLGAEPNPAAVEVARARLGGAGEVIRHEIPEPLPGRFDIMFLFDVLEHLDDDTGALSWAARQLEPGGVLLATVPALDCLWSEQDEAVEHRRRYTRATLLSAVPPGLEVVQLTYYNTLLFLPILAARLAMRLMRPLRRGPPRSHLGVPPHPLNEVLYQLFRLERHLAPGRRLPVGVSLLLVARRPDSAGTPSP